MSGDQFYRKEEVAVRKTCLGVALTLFAVVMAGCGDSGGGGGGGGTTTGGFIRMNGGDSTAWVGGDGGYLEIYTNGIKGIRIIPDATIDTSFTLPPVFSTDYGTEALVVSSDLTIDAYIDQATAQAQVPVGGYYMYHGSYAIWRRAVTADVVVTGIHVLQGKTLTLGLNFNSGNNNGADCARVSIEKDIRIEGTLKVKDLTTGGFGSTLTIDERHGMEALSSDSGSLYLECRRFLLSGRIDTSGSDGDTGKRGGDGGAIQIYCNVGYLTGTAAIDCSGGNGNGDIGGNAGVYSNKGGVHLSTDRFCFIWSDSWLASSGTGIIDARGGSGTSGGMGAYEVSLAAESHLFNKKDIVVDGGLGTTGNGGDAGNIYMYTDYGSCWNSGNFYANGGDTTDGDGGNGGYVYYYNDYNGHCISSGDVFADGGSSVNGNGGSANYFEMDSWSGDLRNTGTILMRGGDGNTTSGSGCSGGNGGNLYVQSYYGYSYSGENQDIVPGDIEFGGSVDISGGKGDTGGAAGHIGISIDDSDSEFATTYGITLAGFSEISFNGGTGTSGGNAGCADIETYYGWEWDNNYYPTGPIEIRGVTFKGNGGTGTGDVGGQGGWLEIYHYDEYALVPEITTMTITGCSAQLNGGNGATGGGNAQNYAVYISSYGDLVLDMNVSANGGNGTGTDANGGRGGYADISSAYGIKIKGTMTFNGGNATGTGNGGEGGQILVVATLGQLTHSARIYAEGGDAVDGVAGNGGYIDVLCNIMPTVVDGGAGYVAGGTATGTGTDGDDGTYTIDWMIQ